METEIFQFPVLRAMSVFLRDRRGGGGKGVRSTPGPSPTSATNVEVNTELESAAKFSLIADIGRRIK